MDFSYLARRNRSPCFFGCFFENKKTWFFSPFSFFFFLQDFEVYEARMSKSTEEQQQQPLPSPKWFSEQSTLWPGQVRSLFISTFFSFLSIFFSLSFFFSFFFFMLASVKVLSDHEVIPKFSFIHEENGPITGLLFAQSLKSLKNEYWED